MNVRPDDENSETGMQASSEENPSRIPFGNPDKKGKGSDRGIQTVLGRIPPESLGICQAHEHLFVKAGPATAVVPSLLLDDYAKTLEELLAFRAAGGMSLVDAQPIGSGRMADLQERVSLGSGVNVVASTGFHRPFFYADNHWIHGTPADRLARLFLEELSEGMYLDGETAWPSLKGTARAGLIKAAAGPDGIQGRWACLFEAAADAARETAAPVLVHTEEGRNGLAIVRFFSDRGVPPEQLILCHLDRIAGNADVMAEVAATGAWLELDTIGRFKAHSDEAEGDMIASLIEKGHGEKLLLGLDVTRARMRAYGGDIGLDYLLKRFLPLLRKQGIPETELVRMLVENPAKALCMR